MAKLLGQHIIVGFTGTVAPSNILGRIRRGEVGEMILFGDSFGVRAARAGADIILYAFPTPQELAALTAAFTAGRISRASALASLQRTVALKRRLTAAPSTPG